MKCPICPKCKTELKLYQTEDWYYDENHNQYYVETIGDCPQCKKTYYWNSVYNLSKFENLRTEY